MLYTFTNSDADGDLANPDNWSVGGSPAGATPTGADTVNLDGQTIQAGNCLAPVVSANGTTFASATSSSAGSIDGGTFTNCAIAGGTFGNGIAFTGGSISDAAIGAGAAFSNVNMSSFTGTVSTGAIAADPRIGGGTWADLTMTG